MALKQPYAVKTVLGNVDLTLKADTGEAFLVKDIYIHNPATRYATLRIEKTTVGFYRVGGPLGSHLAFIPGRSQPITPTDLVPAPEMMTLLAFMIKIGIMKGYPVAEGETFLITGVRQPGAIQSVVYEIYDAEDIKPTDPNGSRPTEYVYINYGHTGAPVNVVGDSLYRVSTSPVEFPAFPFGDDVPAKTEISLVGILASDFAPMANTAADNIWTTHLKLIKEREVLFDEDRAGILMHGPPGANVGGRDRVAEGWSLIGNYSSVDMRKPLIFPEPVVFSPGEELLIFLTTDRAGAGQAIATDRHEIGLIQKVRKLE